MTPPAALALEGVAKAYAGADGPVPVLEHVDLAIAAGASVAIVGPSGSGKSTVLGIAAGLDRPDRGRVAVDGTDLATLAPDALAGFRGRRIGVVFQSHRLLPTLDALENVRVPLDLAGRADAATVARDWLGRVGLAHRARHLPSRLSGGEQQRVALARALAPGPALILADEPTGNLDTATGTAMADLLFGLVADAGAALMLITHDRTLAARAQRALTLRGGRLTDA